MTNTEANFRSELNALLKKYNASIEAEDAYNGYAECGQDLRMIVCIDGTYDDDGNVIRDYCEIDFGSAIFSK